MAKNTNPRLPDLDFEKLNVKSDDSTSLKFLMLVEGAYGQGVKKSIKKYGLYRTTVLPIVEQVQGRWYGRSDQSEKRPKEKYCSF